MGKNKEKDETVAGSNKETDIVNPTENEGKDKKSSQKKDGFFEKLNPNHVIKTAINEAINNFEEKYPALASQTRKEFEAFLESKLPFITANIREETEKLIDHKLNAIHVTIKKIALMLFAITITLTLGIWFLALVIYIK